MKITVLDKSLMGDDLNFDELKKLGEVNIYENTKQSEISSRIKNTDIAILNKVKIGETEMENSKIKLICVFATGYDNIDIEAAKKRNIAVCNVPAYSTNSVTLFTIATALSLYSKLPSYNNYVKSGEYTRSSRANRLSPTFNELAKKTWGIIGCGNIGSSVAKIAVAFGANVIVNKRTPTSDFTCVDIDTLCRDSDIITIHCPLTKETKGLINKEKIKLMKRNVVIVNESRGSVVNESDIATAVLNGNIGAFGADVYSKEPFDETHPFYRIKDCENVILTPHCAWASFEARTRCLEIICQNISSYSRGEKLNRVDL